MSTRTYDRSRRDESARRTRRRLLEVAQEQFVRAGYHATTVSALARAASVSPQTIYNTFGGKAELLKGVWDVLLAGDDEEVAFRDRPEFARVLAQRSAAATLRAYAGVSRLIYERIGPLIGVVLTEGAGADAELAAFLATVDAERRVGNTGVVRHVADRFGLGEGVGVEEAVDHVWTITSADNAYRLVQRCGWSLDAYERWLADGLVSGLRALRR
jgi:AcrR family transcriptional regulator